MEQVKFRHKDGKMIAEVWREDRLLLRELLDYDWSNLKELKGLGSFDLEEYSDRFPRPVLIHNTPAECIPPEEDHLWEDLVISTTETGELYTNDARMSPGHKAYFFGE